MNSRRRIALAGLLAGLMGWAHAAAPDRGPAWVSLTPVQQEALAPLQRDWASIDANRKQKWLEVAARFKTMPSDERLRVQQRMTEWARMTPAERGRARLQFQEVRQLPADERQARWQAYQALPDEERKRLAQRAKPAARPASGAETAAAARVSSETAGSGKRNMVEPSTTTPGRTVAPTVVQVRPGATTTTMSTRVAPPPHHQAGLPKIAATPGFVDPATLLPRRGPQGAAVRAAASAAPAEQP